MLWLINFNDKSLFEFTYSASLMTLTIQYTKDTNLIFQEKEWNRGHD